MAFQAARNAQITDAVTQPNADVADPPAPCARCENDDSSTSPRRHASKIYAIYTGLHAHTSRASSKRRSLHGTAAFFAEHWAVSSRGSSSGTFGDV